MLEKQKIIEVFNNRHACKEFDANKKITAEDFEFILEIARLSPSSFGLEPWQFLVIQNNDLREKLTPYIWGGQKQIPTCSHFVICLSKNSYFMRYDSDYAINFMKNVQKHPKEIIDIKHYRYKKFQQQDFNLLQNDRAITDWAQKQTYIPLANMMTAAQIIGIDSCPIEGFNKEQMNKVLKRELDINIKKYSISYAVCFGYRKREPDTKTRQKIEDIVKYYN